MSVAPAMRRSSSAPYAPSRRSARVASATTCAPEVALLGLVLLRCDEPLVAQVGEPPSSVAPRHRRDAGRCGSGAGAAAAGAAGAVRIRAPRRAHRRGPRRGPIRRGAASARRAACPGAARTLIARRGEVRVLEHHLLVEHRLLEVHRVGDHREVGDAWPPTSSAAVRMSSVPKPKIRPKTLWSSRASLIFSRLVSVTLLLSTPSARITRRSDQPPGCASPRSRSRCTRVHEEPPNAMIVTMPSIVSLSIRPGCRSRSDREGDDEHEEPDKTRATTANQCWRDSRTTSSPRLRRLCVTHPIVGSRFRFTLSGAPAHRPRGRARRSGGCRAGWC